MTQKRELGINPIKFTNINYIGSIGTNWWKTDYYLSKLSTQNILYAAYHEEKTLYEIADLLGLPKNFVAEELNYLESDGFIDKISHDKYITNILINDLPAEISKIKNDIFNKYAKTICQKYIPIFQNQLPTILSKLSTPNSQFPTPNSQLPTNSTLLTLALTHKFIIPAAENLKKHYVKKLDGSEYTMSIDISKDLNISTKMIKYISNGFNFSFNNTQQEHHFSTWIYNTIFDDRTDSWSRLYIDCLSHLHNFIINNAHSSDFMKQLSDNTFYSDYSKNFHDILYKNHLLLPTEKENQPIVGDSIHASRLHNENIVNMIVSTLKKDELVDLLPPMPEDFVDLSHNLSVELFDLVKAYYPSRMLTLLYDTCQNAISSSDMITHILQQALHDNFLQPLTDSQKMTVNMIMFV